MDRAMMLALEADGEKLRLMTGKDHGPHFLRECFHCGDEPEWVGAGWIEVLNNGPISPCPVCNPKGAMPRPTK